MIFNKQTNENPKKTNCKSSVNYNTKSPRPILKDISNVTKKSKLNSKKAKLYPKSYNKYLDPLILTYKDSLGSSRIPRCSTAFDSKIPGYFNTNYGQILLNIKELYRLYDVKLFEYFDADLLDIQVIKKREDMKYLEGLSKREK